MSKVHVRQGREGSLLRYHPWLFAGAIESVDGDPAPGDTVEVIARGERLGWGAYSPHSQIRVRMWSFGAGDESIDALIRRRLARALDLRRALGIAATTTAWRLVNAESDRIPGLVADRYGDVIVCQFLAAGAERWRAEIVDELVRLATPASVFERSDATVREKEGLLPRTGPLAGAAPPRRVEIVEDGRRYLVDPYEGHKTGFYLDQRQHRSLAATRARDRTVLNCFSYTGGFTVAALAGGARAVTEIDTSADALALARENVALGGFAPSLVESVEGDVFQLLRRYRDGARRFDLIILDPPRFAETRAQLEGAERGYKDINLLALKLLAPGGELFTFSCSGQVTAEHFERIVATAARDAARPVAILRRLAHPPDHPTSLTFPEGNYLKGLHLRG